MWSPPPLVRKSAVIAALGLAVVAFDRLTRLPTAEAVASDTLTSAASGQALTLVGAQGPNLLEFQTGAGEGVQLVAQGSPLTVNGHATPSVTWQVSRPPDGAPPTDDNKVDIQVTAAPADRPTVTLTWGGENPGQPVLIIRVANAPVRVDGHLIFGDMRQLPPTALTLGGAVVPGPAISAGFVLPPGGEMRVAFPVLPDLSAKGLVINVGDGDAFSANHLGVREVRVSNLTAASGDAGTPLFATCAAPARRILWRTLWSGGTPSGADCQSDGILNVTRLDIAAGKLEAGLSGYAYAAGDQPIVSRWWAWAQGNAVVSALFAAGVAALLAWARREFTFKPSNPSA